MDIKFFVPYVEAKKRLDIRASIVGRWLEAGSYEDRRGDGVWRRVRTSRMNRDFSVWLLDFKSRGRLVRTEVAPGRRRYGIVPDIDPGEIPDLRSCPMSPVRSPYSTMQRPTATMRWARPVCFRSEGDIRITWIIVSIVAAGNWCFLRGGCWSCVSTKRRCG